MMVKKSSSRINMFVVLRLQLQLCRCDNKEPVGVTAWANRSWF